MFGRLLFTLFLYDYWSGSGFCFKLTPVIELSQGQLQGLENNRGNFRKYLGIPYATFAGRFLDPGPPPPWQDVLNATVGRAYCLQYYPKMSIPIGKEDCLTLNVFTPGQISFKKSLPVMFYIHGGGYAAGNNNELLSNPKPLVNKNVIVVVINYRVGAFGFLCLKIKGASGNMGLKDQIAALQWVNDNIKQFGGDPQSITVFGTSAGAASVNYLILSRETKGMFSRAIMQSGTALSPFAVAFNPIERASLIAAKMGYSTKNPFELLRIFNNATTTDIVMASVVNKSIDPNLEYIFRPCVEKVIFGSKPFMTKSPRQLMEAGIYNQVPVIIGYNNKEGIMFARNFNQDVFDELDQNFESMLPDDLVFTSSKQRSRVASDVRDFYFGNAPLNVNVTDSLVDYFSDSMFHFASVSVAEYLVQNSKYPIFLYYFQYNSTRNAVKETLGNQSGAAHADQMFYLFDPIAVPLPKSKKDVMMIEKMSTMWTNFAKNGNPTNPRSAEVPVKWQPSENGTLRFMIIDEYVRMVSLPNQNRIDFWSNIYSNIFWLEFLKEKCDVLVVGAVVYKTSIMPDK